VSVRNLMWSKSHKYHKRPERVFFFI
jgi:hypothetical protein